MRYAKYIIVCDICWQAWIREGPKTGHGYFLHSECHPDHTLKEYPIDERIIIDPRYPSPDNIS